MSIRYYLTLDKLTQCLIANSIVQFLSLIHWTNMLTLNCTCFDRLFITHNFNRLSCTNRHHVLLLMAMAMAMAILLLLHRHQGEHFPYMATSMGMCMDMVLLLHCHPHLHTSLTIQITPTCNNRYSTLTCTRSPLPLLVNLYNSSLF